MINNIHYIMLDRIFQPKHLYDLIRIGKDNDGGYLVEKKSLKNAKSLISFGISTDWSFEKDFYKLNPVSIHAYDHTVTKDFFYKTIIKSFLKIVTGKITLGIKSIMLYIDYLNFFRKDKVHFLEKIGTEKKSTSLKKVFSRKQENEKPFLMKIDIDGSEYRIMDDLIENASDITGLAIELHDVDIHKEKVKRFIENFPLTLVHIHPNNFADLDKNGNPLVLEMTFSNSPTIINNNIPDIPHVLDQKCDPNSEERIIDFIV